MGGVGATQGGNNPLDQILKAERLARIESQSFLKKGAKGEEVRFLQEKLAAAGFPSTDAAGDFGDGTFQAVQDFQRSMNGTAANGGRAMLVNGNAGDATWGLLHGLTGENMVEPGHMVVDRNQDTFSYAAAKAADDAGGTNGAGRPSNEEIQNNVYTALANHSATDTFNPEHVQPIVDALKNGKPPGVPQEVLVDLGVQAIEAARGEQPRTDYAYPGAQLSNRDFDTIVGNLMGAALAATPEAGLPLVDRYADDPDALKFLEGAQGTGPNATF